MKFHNLVKGVWLGGAAQENFGLIKIYMCKGIIQRSPNSILMWIKKERVHSKFSWIPLPQGMLA